MTPDALAQKMRAQKMRAQERLESAVHAYSTRRVGTSGWSGKP